MKLSIVTTLYRSQPYIHEFHRRATNAANELAGDDYEIIYVNDGSPDDSLSVAVGLAEKDEHIVVVDLSRNFGHHKAMMAGLEHSTGDMVFLIDSDLEEDPAWLIEFDKLLSKEGSDVVYGTQISRKGGWFERWSGNAFYTFYNWVTEIDHPRNIVTSRLMTRKYVEALLQHHEREMVISYLWIITGFEQVGMPVAKLTRSETTYSFSGKIKHVTNAITSSSEAPLRMIFYMGLMIFFSSIFYASYLIFNRIFLSQPVDGWTSVMVSIWVLGGMVISFIGVIGIYLSKVFIETKVRPNYIVRRIYGKAR
jgi:putative glycosyltransferase